MPPPPSPYATPDTITTPRMPLRVENSTLDRFLPRDKRRRVPWGLLGDGGVGAVDPLAADVEVGLAGAGEGFDRRIDDCGVQVRAGLVARDWRCGSPRPHRSNSLTSVGRS